MSEEGEMSKKILFAQSKKHFLSVALILSSCNSFIGSSCGSGPGLVLLVQVMIPHLVRSFLGSDLSSCWFMVPGSWFMVPGSWFLVHGSWFMVLAHHSSGLVSLIHHVFSLSLKKKRLKIRFSLQTVQDHVNDWLARC
jgi:hypothetical protein